MIQSDSWTTQLSALAKAAPRTLGLPLYAEIHTSVAGQALAREERILALLREHGPHDTMWVAKQMNLTTQGARCRLNQMLDKGTVCARHTWPRTWAAPEPAKKGRRQ